MRPIPVYTIVSILLLVMAQAVGKHVGRCSRLGGTRSLGVTNEEDGQDVLDIELP